MNVRRKKQIQRLRLANIWRPVSRKFNQPALIYFKGRLKDRFLIIIKKI